MKEAKTECAEPKKPNKPNLKNKLFAQWSRGESCKREDNIISTDWHEKLQKTTPFVPVYNNTPLNMTYLLSGEYGRIWLKERDEWYSNVFVSQGKEKDMEDRRKKIQRQMRAEKKAAQIKIQERKERKAKEAELKAKAEAERLEKLKAKIQKCAAKKEAKKKPKKKEETEQTQPQTSKKEKTPPTPHTEATNQEFCGKGWTPVELTVQCECSHHKERNDEVNKVQSEKPESEKVQNQKAEEQTSPTICLDYCKQLAEIQNTQLSKAFKESETNVEQTNSGKPDKTCCACKH